jgi:predicted MFS family arabinose efflux permease
VPAAPRRPRAPLTRAQFGRVAADPELARINFGIFSLHAAQVAIFVVLPGWLVERAGLAIADHWMLYLPVVLLSFAPMMPAVGWGERSGRGKGVFIASVALLVAVLVGLALRPEGVVLFAVLLFVFFSAFNILEASLPSMASRRAPAELRGAALGLFNTTQSLGLFVGGAAAGLVRSTWGDAAVFMGAAMLLGAWLLAALWHRRWPDAAH